MCLPDFIRFEQTSENNPLIGYRSWSAKIKGDDFLRSQNENYIWSNPDGPHLVLDKNSGLYSYNYNYCNNNNYNYNYNNYNYNYNNYYNYNYYYYNIGGIIHQYGKIGIHETGYRSEYAKIDSIFSIREQDAKGPNEFLGWIKIFNEKINRIAEKYNCKVITWQDFVESQRDHIS